MSDFGQLLRLHRRNSKDPERGGPLTQPRLVELLETWAGLPGYHFPQVSDWERNVRPIAHTNRELLNGLVLVLHRCGGLTTLAEANALLRAGGYSDMSETEIRQVNPEWATPAQPAATPTSPPPTSPVPPAVSPISPPAAPAHPPPLSAFVVGPPITNPQQFFGRTAILKRLFSLWNTFPLEHAAIIGLQRSGKTSLLHYVKQITRPTPGPLRPDQRRDWLKQPDHYRWILVDFQDSRMGNLERLLQYLLTELGLTAPEGCSMEQFMDLVSYRIQTPTVLLMDELGAALSAPELGRVFWENLRSLANNYANGNLGYVLTAHASPLLLAQNEGKSSPFFNIFRTIKLGPLEEQEARALIASSPQPFPPADVEWILAQSRLWPSLVQLLCKLRLTLGDDAEPDAWKAEGLMELERFQYLFGQP